MTMTSDGVLGYVIDFIRVLRIADVVDVFIVAVAVYYFMAAIKGTRAVQLAKGLVAIFIAYMLSSMLRLHTLKYLLDALVQVAMFGVIVIFQPELRSVLEKIGRFKIGNILGTTDSQDLETVVSGISSAAADMSRTKTGALIVIERQTRLGEYMNSGTVINADVSKEMLKNIFFPNTALHDGAVIVRQNKILTAGCVLPLTANTNLASELGTRHRAALGLSETSDAVVVVVSEETGKISVAVNGSLTRNLTEASLNKALTRLLAPVESEVITPVKKKIFHKSR